MNTAIAAIVVIPLLAQTPTGSVGTPASRGRDQEIGRGAKGILAVTPYVIDQSYATFASACSAAGTSATLLITKSWTALASQTCDANLHIHKGGMLQPANAASVTLTGSLNTGLFQIFDLSLGGGAMVIPQNVENIYPQWWGAKGNGVNDDASAFQAALNTLYSNHLGGRLALIAATFKIMSELTIQCESLIIEGAGLGGNFDSGIGSHSGSYILLGANIAGGIFRIIRPAYVGSSSAVYGVHIRNLTFYGNNRSYAVIAALYVHDAFELSVDNVKVRDIKGSGILSEYCIKCHFANINMLHSGDSGHPAFDANSRAPNVSTQGSTFSGIKIESCYGAPYFHFGPNAEENKIDGATFETPEPALAATNQSYYVDQGTRNTISKISFNNDVGSSVVTPGLVMFQGYYGSMSDSTMAGGNSMTYMTVSGQGYRFSNLHFYDCRDGTSVRVSGRDNQFSNIQSRYACGIYVGKDLASGPHTEGGQFTQIANYFQGDGRTIALDINADSVQINGVIVRDPIYATTIAKIAGNYDELAHFSVWGASSNTSEAVLLSGTAPHMLGGSLITVGGHGIRITGDSGMVEGVQLLGIGKHGIFVDGAQPYAITHNSIKQISTSHPGNYDGISFRTPSGFNSTQGGTCSDNNIDQGGGIHRYSIHVPIGINDLGVPAYQNWHFVGNNVTRGGAVSIAGPTNYLSPGVPTTSTVVLANNTPYRNISNQTCSFTISGGTVSDISISTDRETFDSTGQIAGTFVVPSGAWIKAVFTLAPTTQKQLCY